MVCGLCESKVGVTGNRVWLSIREPLVSEGFGHGIFYASSA